jgi:RHS repeat-associated protein
LKNRSTGLDPNVPTLQNLGYTYDFVGNMTSITDPLFTATRDLLVYDDLNRLIQASGKFGGTDQSQTTCNYSYSSIGDLLNKCSVTYTYGNAMHPSFVTATSDGNTYSPDLNGNTLTGAGRTFTWTADNRAATINNASGTTAMDYDYAGARLKKFGPLGLTVYPFPGYEIDTDGVKIKYIQLGNELLAAKKSSSEKMFYHNDHLGGVNVITDINGLRTELMEYDPWGKVSRQESTSNAVDPSHAFTGQELDKETDLYFYDGRYYDQQLARFVQPDPFVMNPNDPQNFNRYSYVLNNPYRYIDPSGYEGEGEGESEDEEQGETINDYSCDSCWTDVRGTTHMGFERSATEVSTGSIGGQSPTGSGSNQGGSSGNNEGGDNEEGLGGNSGGKGSDTGGRGGLGFGGVLHEGFQKQVEQYLDKGIRSSLKNHEKMIEETIIKLAKEAVTKDPGAIKHHLHDLRMYRDQLKIVEREAIKRGITISSKVAGLATIGLKIGGVIGFIIAELADPATLNANEMDYLNQEQK